MFEFVAKYKKWIMIAFLALIVPPFALFGVDIYFRDVVRPNTVARVGDYSITEEEFAQALRDRQMALQQALAGQRIDPAVLDNPELRRDLLDSLIRRRLLVQEAIDSGLVVTDAQLKATIDGLEAFRGDNGQFSYDLYVQHLRAQGMTPGMFEARLRQDLLITQLAEGLAQSGFVSRTRTDLLVERVSQERELSQAEIKSEAFLPRVTLKPDAARQYYDANPGEFRVPEQVRVEYVVLSTETLMPKMEITAEEVKQYYDANLRRFGVEETRSAAHILIAADASASEADKKKALARAEELHRELLKKPEGFAEAAKKHSQDPGSASRGGDLGGRISRGTMKDMPQLEQAIFGLKPGEISRPVETQYGYHIVKVTGIEPAKVKPFEEVRAEIERELRGQKAGRRFAELAEQFSNTVYEQSDTLKPAAELIGGEVRTSGWLTRRGGDPAVSHPRMIDAIFSDEALKERRNTETIEVAPGRIVAARVVEHKPAVAQPFEEVKAELEKRLALREASRLAAQEGRRLLEELRKGAEVKVDWSKPEVVTRDETKGFPLPVLRQAFRMDVSKLPAYSGVEVPQGFVLLRVTRARTPENLPAEKTREIAEQFEAMLAQETLAAYVQALRQKVGVEVFPERLQKNNP